MRKTEFFTVLKKDLPEDKYKARLLRELEDHWEDCGSGEKAEHRLGDPHEFISFYKDVMKKNTSLYLEALFIGLCSMPLILLPFIGNSFTESTENYLAKAVLWLITLVGIGFFYFIFYRWVWTRLSASQKIEGRLAKKLLPLLMVPSWWVLGLVALLVRADQGQDYFFPLVIASYAFAQVVAAWKARVHLLGAQGNRWLSAGGFLLMVGLFVILPALSGEALGEALYTLFYFVRVGLFIPFGMNNTLAVIVLGVAALLMMAYSFFVVVQRLATGKSFAWGKAAIGLLLLYGFVTPAERSNLITWELPAVNLTSAWEQDELGLFYTWYRFLTNDGERTFYYALDHGSEAVRVADQEGHEVEFTALSLEASELEWVTVEDTADFVSVFTNGPVDLPEEFTCVDPDAPDGLSEVLVLGGETYCREFYYKDQLVFSAPVAASISDVLVTSDEQWLIVHFPEQSWGPGLYQHDSVFAVDLSSL